MVQTTMETQELNKYKLKIGNVPIGDGTVGSLYSLSYTTDGKLSLLRDGVPVGEPIDIFQNNQPSDIIIRYSSYDVNNPSISNDENDNDYYDYYDHNNCELCIENCEACDRAWHKQFEDNDVWMAIGKTLENGDPDLAWSFIRVNTKDGKDGEDGKDGSPIVSVYFNPSIITYPSGGHRDYNDNNSNDSKIEIFAYKGTTRVKVIALRDTSNNPITLNTTESLGEIVSQIINSYRADDNSPVKFIATVLLDVDEDENDITLNYIVMLNKQEITNPELDNYMLVVTPNVVVVDVNLQIGYTLTGKLYQNGNEVNNPTLTWDYSRIANNHNGNTVSVSQQGSSITITSDTLSTTELNNSDFIECSYIVNGNQVILKQTIPFLRNSQLILSKYLIRDRGKWTNLPDDPQNFESYRNDSLRGHTLESNNYIDVVWWDCNSDDDDAPRGYYMPKLPLINPYEPVTYPVNSEESLPPEYFDDVKQLYRLNPLWQKAISMDFAYIRTLIAETISAHSVQANEVLIIKKVSNQLKIVAGMTSSDRINPNESPVRIWAGTTDVNKDLDGKIDCNDLTLAPFRVYEDGSVVALKLILAIDDKLYKVNLNMQLPKPIKGQLGYLMITDSSNDPNYSGYTISFEDGVTNSFIMLLNNDNTTFGRLTQVTLTQNGVYFICGLEYDGELVWFLTHTSYKEGSGLSWIEKTVNGNILLKLQKEDDKIYLYFQYSNFVFNDITDSNLNNFIAYQIHSGGRSLQFFNGQDAFQVSSKSDKSDFSNLVVEINGNTDHSGDPDFHTDTIYFSITGNLKLINGASPRRVLLGYTDQGITNVVAKDEDLTVYLLVNNYVNIPVTAKLYHLESNSTNKVILTIPIAGTTSELLVNPNTKEILGSVDFTSLKIYNTSGRSLNFSHNGDNYIVGPLVEELSLTDILLPIAPVNNP